MPVKTEQFLNVVMQLAAIMLANNIYNCGGSMGGRQCESIVLAACVARSGMRTEIKMKARAGLEW